MHVLIKKISSFFLNDRKSKVDEKDFFKYNDKNGFGGDPGDDDDNDKD